MSREIPLIILSSHWCSQKVHATRRWRHRRWRGGTQPRWVQGSIAEAPPSHQSPEYPGRWSSRSWTPGNRCRDRRSFPPQRPHSPSTHPHAVVWNFEEETWSSEEQEQELPISWASEKNLRVCCSVVVPQAFRRPTFWAFRRPIFWAFRRQTFWAYQRPTSWADRRWISSCHCCCGNHHEAWGLWASYPVATWNLYPHEK